MTALLILLCFQSQSAPVPPIDLTAHHFSVISTPDNPLLRDNSTRLNLDRPAHTTSGPLTPTSDVVTNYELGLEVGDQRAVVYELKSHVASLAEQREKTDRPDIESLKASRDHIEWTWGIISTACLTAIGVLWSLYGKFKTMLWEDSVRPRIKKILTDLIEKTESPVA